MCYGLARRLPLSTARGVIEDLRMRYYCDVDLCTIFERTELTGKDKLVHGPFTRTNSISVSDIQQSLFSPSK